MYRLVKNIDKSNMFPEFINEKMNTSTYNYSQGSAAVLKSGSLRLANSSEFPEFILTSSSHTFFKNGKADAFYITEDMIFKVEYVGNAVPKIGMPVGIAKYNSEADAVTSNSSGKGVIVALDDNPLYVYVKFHR